MPAKAPFFPDRKMPLCAYPSFARYAGGAAHLTCEDQSNWPCTHCSRKANFWILPEPVSGNSAT